MSSMKNHVKNHMNNPMKNPKKNPKKKKNASHKQNGGFLKDLTSMFNKKDEEGTHGTHGTHGTDEGQVHGSPLSKGGKIKSKKSKTSKNVSKKMHGLKKMKRSVSKKMFKFF